MTSDLFRIELSEQSLVVTFDRPCNVVSWSPLHGGFRSNVSHFLVRQFGLNEVVANEETLLRQTAGRLRLKGTVVGAGTTANVESRRTSVIRDGDLLVSLLALLPHNREIPQPRSEPLDTYKHRYSPQLLVVLNKRVAHEVMLETMALAVDLRRRLWVLPTESKDGKRSETAPDVDWVVVSTFDEERYRGDLRALKVLASKALALGLKFPT